MDQETAQWLRWDRVRADRGLLGFRTPRLDPRGVGPSFLPPLLGGTESFRKRLLRDGGSYVTRLAAKTK